MRDFIKVLVPAFLLFAAVGAVAGFGKRYERAKTKVYKTLEVRYDEKTREAVLLSSCDKAGGVRFRHWVDSDVTEPVGTRDKLFELTITSLGPASPRHMELTGILGGFLGGATAGFRLKDVLKHPATKGWKKTIWGLAGAISGYAAGYIVVSNLGTGCDSRFMVQLRNDTEAWVVFERMKLALTLKELQSVEDAWLDKETGEPKYRSDRDPVFRCATRGMAEWQAILDPVLTRMIENPVSRDFQLLHRLKRYHDRLRQSPAYATLVDLRRIKDAAPRIKMPEALAKLGYSEKSWNEACAELEALTLSEIRIQ